MKTYLKLEWIEWFIYKEKSQQGQIKKKINLERKPVW